VKNKNIFFIVGLIILAVVYLFLRLNKLEERMVFHMDQGLHLSESWQMVTKKDIQLIGPMASKTYLGKKFFVGANYYYILGVVGLIGQWNPLKITTIFIFLELGFYLFFIFFLKRKFNNFWSLIVFLFISISPYLIIHSRFFWNPHLLVPLSILVLYFGDKYLFKGKSKYLFLAAFFWGFGIACHYSAIFWGLFFVYLLVKLKQVRVIKSYLIMVMGFILGDLPWFIFELRHGFYNTKTMFYVFMNSNSGREITSHYFVFPLLVFIIFGLLLIKKNKKINGGILMTLLFGLFFIQIIIYKNYQPLDVVEGWNYPRQKEVINRILKNGCLKNFNVASTVGGDTRSYDLRFLLTTRSCFPMGVEEYPKTERLFLIAPINRPPETEKVWEVSSLDKYKVNRQEKLTEKIVFWDLSRI